MVTACGALAGILLLGVAGRVLGLSRTPERRAATMPWMGGVVLLLFLVLGCSLMPLMLHSWGDEQRARLCLPASMTSNGADQPA